MKRPHLVLVAVLVVVVTSVVLAVGFTGKSVTSGCRNDSNTKTRYITIKDGKVSQADINGNLCDTLTFTNADNTIREIAFGPHEHHIPYDGVEERLLPKGHSLTITFNATGVYHWHDHLHDEVQGNFTVAK